MNQQQDQLATLNEIRNIMDRSSRFISLSGLAGVFAGLFALAGAAAVKWHFDKQSIQYREEYSAGLDQDTIMFMITVAALVLLLAFASAVILTVRKARKNNLRSWDSKSKRLLINFSIPLAVGGIFCAVLVYHGMMYLVPPAMLIFYGLALVSGSKYTLSDIRYLGICDIILGLLASFFVGYGLLSWTIGFGVLHIIYGTLMYLKYERN